MSSRFGTAAPVCECGLYAGNKSGPRARFAGKYAVYGQIITSGAMMRVEFLILNSFLRPNQLNLKLIKRLTRHLSTKIQSYNTLYRTV